MNDVSKKLTRIIDSATFSEGPQNRVLSAIAQMYKYYLVGDNHVALVDFRMTFTGFCFIVAGRACAQGTLTWSAVDEDKNGVLLREWIDTKLEPMMSIERASEVGNSLMRVSSTLRYMRSVQALDHHWPSAREREDEMVEACKKWRGIESIESLRKTEAV